jgi:hypothetical protein
MQLLLSNGMMYSTVAYAAISMDCAENTTPVVVYRPLFSKDWLL